MDKMEKYDIIIIGAGAAGLMCGQVAGKRGYKVLILDKSGKAGGKIPISGGGKCNFTNNDCSADDFYSENPHFVKSALARFSQWDTLALLEENGIAWELRDHGRYFCQHSSSELVTLLCELCRNSGVLIRLNSQISKVERSGEEHIITVGDTHFGCEKLVVASGSCAWPQCGTTDIGYDIARDYGHKIIPVCPALVPLHYNKTDAALMAELTGNSVLATVNCGRYRFQEEVLFTHHGLSGPAILQISCIWPHEGKIHIDWLAGFDLTDAIEKGRASDGSITISKLLHGRLPRKFLQIWQRYYEDIAIANLSASQISQAVESFNSWHFQPSGTAGFSKAEAASGGVSTNELSSKNMGSKLARNLYFIGEVVDVTGALGGYNLQWAFSSGYCCGLEI
ncbi:MAG: aminoacetone oxidase family FAD-binding enzyme [Sedimentisphaerales bacterium]|nr:aminoacetone oxidase family FAD-binding enzyme [Sedimentisphaerales bacterium]MBN2841738.1 aminoacetone oxidase family FAD-binding enzyme [Sedimentisphaerales bacterium]